MKKRGALLIELCIAMALVAVLSTMVGTFMMLMRQRTVLNQNRDDLLRDLSSAETAVKQWLLHYDNYDYTMSVEDNNRKLAVTSAGSGAQTYRLYYSNNMIHAGWANGEQSELTYVTTHLVGMTFQLAPEGGSTSGKRLIKCTVRYRDPKNNTEKTTEFIFSTHAQSSILRKAE